MPHNSGFLKFPIPAMADYLPAIEIETAPNPQYSVIWMHGLGAHGSDFESVPPMLDLGNGPGIRFIFPHAPEIPVSCNGGVVMGAWYDIISITRTSRIIDEDGLLETREAIRRLIARENQRGVPTARVFLAGFSQGGAMAYATGLTHGEPLAGIIALSTYLPSSEVVRRELAQARREIPVFAAHGSEDDVVAPEMGEGARDTLLEMGFRVDWHTFPMAHSVSLGEIRALGNWLRERLGSQPK